MCSTVYKPEFSTFCFIATAICKEEKYCRYHNVKSNLFDYHNIKYLNKNQLNYQYHRFFYILRFILF